MPGVTRRNKPLRGTTAVTDVQGFSITNATAGDLLVYSGSEWANTKALTGPYTITGALTADDLTITNDTTIQNDLTVSNDLTVTGSTSLAALTASGAAILQSTLAVTGAATFADTLAVTGTLSGAGFSLSGNATITGTLGVTGASTFGTLTATTSTLGAATATTLGVTGLALFSDDANVAGSLTAGGLIVSGDIAGTNINASNAITLSGDLTGSKWSIADDATDLTWLNTRAASRVLVTGTTTAAAAVSMLVLDPDAGVIGYHLTEQAFNTDTAANGGLFANNADTGGGLERVLTTADLALTGLTGGNWKTLHTNGSGATVELALGASGDVLTSNGVAAAPTWQTPSGGSSLTNFQDNSLVGEILYNSIVAAASDIQGFIIADTSGDDPLLQFHDDAGADVGWLFFGSTGGYLWNRHDGQTFILYGNDAGGTLHKQIEMDPDGPTDIYYDGIKAGASGAGGMNIYDTSGDDPYLNAFEDDGSTVVYSLGHNASGSFLYAQVNSDWISLYGKNSSGTFTALGHFDPDGAGKLYYAGNVALETISGSIKFGTHTGIGAETVTGYITIQDSGGTSRKIAVVS